MRLKLSYIIKICILSMIVSNCFGKEIIKENFETLKDSEYHKMGIRTNILGLKRLQTTKPKLYDFIIKKLIPSVVNHIQDTLLIKGTRQTTISVDDCYNVNIPYSIRGKTFDADLYLFFTVESKESDSFVAWATPCQQLYSTSRPNIGQVNFNENFIKMEKRLFFDQFSTILHEIYHILGINSGLLNSYVDSSTNRKLPRGSTTRIYPGEQFPNRIVSKNTLEFGRKHFDCDTLQGIPLEDEGGKGSIGSHWEKVVLGNEMMVGNQVANPVLSNFSLNLLQDSGWYKVNYEMAEPFFWEKGKGCGVLDGQCGYYGEHCTRRGQQGCFYDHTFIAVCNRGEFSNQCNFFTSTDFSRHDCRVENNQQRNYHLSEEAYGLGSRCVDGKISSGRNLYLSMCFKMKCKIDSSSILLSVGDATYECRKGGDRLEIRGYQGYINCPDVKDFCDQEKAGCPNECNLNGRCQVNNRCHCYYGYTGLDCSQVDSSAKPFSSYDDSTTTPIDQNNGEEGSIIKRSCPNDCSGNGRCLNNGTCRCFLTYKGKSCEREIKNIWDLIGGDDGSGNTIISSSFIILLMIVLLNDMIIDFC